MFLSGISRGELLQLHLAINIIGLVEPNEPGSVWEKFQLYFTSTCLLELLAAEHLCETKPSVVYLIYCFLFFRSREKSFEEEINKNKDGNSRGVTTSQLPQTEIGMMKFLALTSHLLVRQNNTDFNVIFSYAGRLKKSIFRNLT